MLSLENYSEDGRKVFYKEGLMVGYSLALLTALAEMRGFHASREVCLAGNFNLCVFRNRMSARSSISRLSMKG